MVHRSEILLKFDTINSEKEGGRQRVQFDESGHPICKFARAYLMF